MADMVGETDDATGATGATTVTRPRGLFQTPNLHIPQFRQATPAPAPASPPDPRADEAWENLYTAAQAIQQSIAAQDAAFTEICSVLQDVVKLLKKAARIGVYNTISLAASRPYTLDTQDYFHSYLLLTATQNVIFDIPGVGSITRSLAADWNRLDYPSGTRISLSADPANPVNGLLRLQDEQINV